MDKTHAHYPIEFLLLEYLLQDKHLFILYLYILSFNYIISTISDILITSQHKAIADHVNFCIFPFTITAFAILKITNAMCIISKIIELPPKICQRNSAFLPTSYSVILCLITYNKQSSTSHSSITSCGYCRSKIFHFCSVINIEIFWKITFFFIKFFILVINPFTSR